MQWYALMNHNKTWNAHYKSKNDTHLSLKDGCVNCIICNSVKTWKHINFGSSSLKCVNQSQRQTQLKSLQRRFQLQVRMSIRWGVAETETDSVNKPYVSAWEGKSQAGFSSDGIYVLQCTHIWLQNGGPGFMKRPNGTLMCRRCAVSSGACV